MKRIRLSGLISLGQSARFLLDVKEGWRFHGDSWIIANAERVLSHLEHLKFRVTVEAAHDLREILTEFKAYPAESRASAADRKRLNEIMQTLRATMKAESRTLHAYLLSEKRLGVEKLVERPELFLSGTTFSRLPRVAKLDIREAASVSRLNCPLLERSIFCELPRTRSGHTRRCISKEARTTRALGRSRPNSSK
jgi:hypothetical protein